MKITFLLFALFLIVGLQSCSDNKENKGFIDEDELGFINADVESEETNFKYKARFTDNLPGESEKINRSFENAPPLIPHTTKGFFPIEIDKNICLSCHLPEFAEKVGAIKLPLTHFTNLRPEIKKTDRIYQFDVKVDEMVQQDLEHFNNAYFNCSQCHVPQAKVSVDIENLFTVEFRNKFGLESSNLKEHLGEGIK